MRLDQFSNPIFNDTDLIDALYQGQEILSDIYVDTSTEIQTLAEMSGLSFKDPLPDDAFKSIVDFDQHLQSQWFMPDEYKQLDVEGYLVNICPKQNYQRLIDELHEFKARDMLNLLRWLKYFVDTCTEKNVVWGVGRGSSVASYVLFLLGVHSIDPIQYNLDWREFLR